MDELRKPFFFIALAAIVLVVLLEVGTRLLLGGQDVGADLAGQSAHLGVAVPPDARTPPGLGVAYLALVDGCLLFTVALMGVGLVVPQRLHGRVQSVATFVFALSTVILAIVLIVVALAMLILMVTLLLAFPFGTIAYLIGWGFFPRGQTTALLGLVMFLKLVFGGFLLAAQPRFIANKGLVLLTLTSLLCTIVVEFLQGLVPGILVSITDAVAAIVVGIVAVVWAVVLLIGSIPGMVRAAKATARPPKALPAVGSAG